MQALLCFFYYCYRFDTKRSSEADGQRCEKKCRKQT